MMVRCFMVDRSECVENGERLMEVTTVSKGREGRILVDDVNEIVSVHNVLYELPCWRIMIVALGPVISQPISLILQQSVR